MGRRSGKGGPIFHGDQAVLFNQQQMADLHVKAPESVRFNRGYTPERRNEVRDLVGGRIYRQRDMQDDSPFKGHINEAREHSWMGRREGEAKLVETIARSTMPLDSLQMGDRPTFHIMDRSMSDAKEAGSYHRHGIPRTAHTQPGIIIRGEPTSGGLFDQDASDADAYAPPPPSRRSKKMAEASSYVRESHEQTLLHELGHHDSAFHETMHSQAYGNPYHRGSEEAYADDYKDTHFVRDPRDVKRSSFDPRPGHAYDAYGQPPRDPYRETDSDQRLFEKGYAAQRSAKPPFTSTEERLHRAQEADKGMLFTAGMVSSSYEPGAVGNRRHSNKWRLNPDAMNRDQFG